MLDSCLDSDKSELGTCVTLGLPLGLLQARKNNKFYVYPLCRTATSIGHSWTRVFGRHLHESDVVVASVADPHHASAMITDP